jgi:hypothetical protein
VSNIFMRPTFRPPIIMRPTSIYQHIFNTRSTTTTTPVSNTSTSLATVSPTSIATTDISYSKIPTTPTPTTTTLDNDSSNIVSQIHTKKPIISSRGIEI